MAMAARISLLGGFDVDVDGTVVPAREWNRRNSAGLVKLLALTPNRRLHREQVIDALWPDLLVDEAAPRLHKAAHYARRALGPRTPSCSPARRSPCGRATGRSPSTSTSSRGGRVGAGRAGRSTARIGPVDRTAATCCPRTPTSRGRRHLRDRLAGLHRELSAAHRSLGGARRPSTRPTRTPTWS